jgi:hypothetical protein
LSSFATTLSNANTRSETMGKWWLITWTTYASWLPGDPRGYRTFRGRFYVPPPKRFAREGERIYEPEKHAAQFRMAQAAARDEVSFTEEHKQIAFQAILDEIAELQTISAALSVGSQHAHWVAMFEERRIRATVGRIKAKATSRLNKCGFTGHRPWTKGCDMKSKPTCRALESAIEYVKAHLEEGCLVMTWPVHPDHLPAR